MKDINGDGRPNLITGKRWLAYIKGDTSTDNPSVLYWFEFIAGKKPQWIPPLVDDNSWVGNCFVVADTLLAEEVGIGKNSHTKPLKHW